MRHSHAWGSRPGVSLKSAVVAGTLLGLGVFFGCATEAPNLENGARCSLNSDCRSPLVCGFERCRPQCQTSRDCSGKLCVRGNLGGNVCQLDDEVACTHNSECPGSQLCGIDRHCRDVCITDKDCVTDLLCASRTCAKPEELVNGALPEKTPADAGAFCTYATDCPGDLVCLYGVCDVECLGDKDCLVGWSCNPRARVRAPAGDGRCYPTAATRDAAVDVAPDGMLLDSGPGDAAIAMDAATDAGADAGDGSDGSAPPIQAVAVTAGEAHICVTFSHGRIKCWGQNDVGQLGLGDTMNRGAGPNEMGDNLPYVDLGTGITVQSLASNGLSTCAIVTGNKVKCWGFNDLGQLGLGDSANRGDGPNEMGDNLPFVDLGTGRTAKSITMNSFSACAVLDNDKVKCWGQNNVGQLGLGDTQVRGDGPNEMGDALPYVDLGTGLTVKAFASGRGSTCAILDNDKMKCWGWNAYGQLGAGSAAHRGDGPNEMGDNMPYVDLGTGRTVKALAAQGASVCAILDDDKVKCWGWNGLGNLGLGNVSYRGDNPNEMGDNLPYVSLGTGHTAKAIVATRDSTCAVLNDDRMKCFGSNGFGQLGIGDNIHRGDGPNEMGDALPYVDLGTGRSPKLLAGGRDSICALLDDISVKCFGWNGSGNLGLGDTLSRGNGPNQMGNNLPSVKLIGP